MLSTIYTDADNTLWDTDAVFQAAQLALLEGVEQIVGTPAPGNDRLAFVRDFDQAIASQHHDRLRYPPGLLAHALALGLQGASSGKAARTVIRQGSLAATDDAVDRFAAMLEAPPQLLPGVREGMLLAARDGFELYVVTEGSQQKAASTLRQHGLLEQTGQVLSATKSVELYRRLKTRAESDFVGMIGDQLDRDVLLAREAGLLAVWVPSAFRPKWVDPGRSKDASFTATDFLAAISWLLKTRDERALHRRSLTHTSR